jgi:hypothetical protein
MGENNTDEYIKDINDLASKEYTNLKNLNYSQNENEEESNEENIDSDY